MDGPIVAVLGLVALMPFLLTIVIFVIVIEAQPFPRHPTLGAAALTLAQVMPALIAAVAVARWTSATSAFAGGSGYVIGTAIALAALQTVVTWRVMRLARKSTRSRVIYAVLSVVSLGIFAEDVRIFGSLTHVF